MLCPACIVKLLLILLFLEEISQPVAVQRTYTQQRDLHIRAYNIPSAPGSIVLMRVAHPHMASGSEGGIEVGNGSARWSELNYVRAQGSAYEPCGDTEARQHVVLRSRGGAWIDGRCSVPGIPVSRPCAQHTVLRWTASRKNQCKCLV